MSVWVEGSQRFHGGSDIKFGLKIWVGFDWLEKKGQSVQGKEPHPQMKENRMAEVSFPGA